MRIFHITSPEAAYEIVRTGTFRPTYCNSYGADAGLNCFPYKNKEEYCLGQAYTGNGAMLILEWSGAIRQISKDKNPPPITNILYNQTPWRCFIRYKTDPKLIKIIGIEFIGDAANDLVRQTFWQKYLPSRLAKPLFERKKNQILLEIQDMCSDLHLEWG